MVTKAVSRAQARLFGAVIGGNVREISLTEKQARNKLRGVKYKKLPERIRKKKK